MIYKGLPECCREDFLHNIADDDKLWLFDQLDALPSTIEARRSAFRLYESELSSKGFSAYPFQKGAVPWRYNILLNVDMKKKLVKQCLENGLPVSDWYPCVTELFDEQKDFPGAKKHEEMILNFPLLIEEAQIKKICKIINEVCL